MRQFGIVALAFAMLVIGASKAAAQDARKAGITMSTGSSVGVYIPLGDNAAIQPGIDFGRSTSDYEGSQFINDSITTTTWAPGVSLLFFVKSWDATRLYVSPQYTYARNSSDLDDDEPRSAHSAAGMIGAQHRFGSRFAMFAETGLSWGRSKSTTGPTSSVTSTAWSTRSTVGGILFF